MRVSRVKSLAGEIELPGDKSISHRAAIIGAISDGETVIKNYSTGRDCDATLNCLRQLGINALRNGKLLNISGGRLTKPEGPLDCGNSGTTIRLLSGVLAGHDFSCRLTGDESLLNRPMNRIIKPLIAMGARIKSRDGRAPLEISGRSPLKSVSYELTVASAQLKSAILLASLYGDATTRVTGPPSRSRVSISRNHTELMLGFFGADIVEHFHETDDGFVQELAISSMKELKPQPVYVPGDISSASFFIAAASVLEGSDIVIRDLGLNPTRTGIIDLMKNCGANIEIGDRRRLNREESGSVRIRSSADLRHQSGGLTISGDILSSLIDEIPILAVLGTQLAGGITIRDAEELRVKESDRISAIVNNLRKMKADVTEYDDGLRVGRSDLSGAKVDSYGDHRIAMAFAIAGLFADGHTEIVDSECVDVSFPSFFQVLESVVK